LRVFLTAVFVLTCIVLTALVLVQGGKETGFIGAFGGSGSQTILGTGRRGFLAKLTVAFGILFFGLALLLQMIPHKGRLILAPETAEVTATQPAGTPGKEATAAEAAGQETAEQGQGGGAAAQRP